MYHEFFRAAKACLNMKLFVLILFTAYSVLYSELQAYMQIKKLDTYFIDSMIILFNILLIIFVSLKKKETGSVCESTRSNLF